MQPQASPNEAKVRLEAGRKFNRWALGLLGAILLLCCGCPLLGGTNTEGRSAFIQARYFVKQAYEGKGDDLEFPIDPAAATVRKEGEDVFEVSGYVVRDNHFDPATHIPWKAVVRRGRNDYWRLESLTN